MEKKEYKERRKKLHKLANHQIIIIPAAKELIRNNDAEYPFRQDSNFYYLSGFHEPDAILVIHQGKKQTETSLFVRPKDQLMELWTGIRTGAKKAKTQFGVDHSYELKDFERTLKKLLIGHDHLYIDLHHNNSFKNKMMECLTKLRPPRKNDRDYPSNVSDIIPLVGKLRLQKSNEEIKVMKKAAAITAQGHLAAMAITAPGKNEKDVQDFMEYIFKKNGAQSNAYTSIVAGGANANVLHYIENNQKLKSGDLLLIDAGSEFNNYASDVTRTFPINGKFTAIQKEIYEIVLQAQKNCIKAAKPGVTQSDIHKIAVESMLEGLLESGHLKGSFEEHIKKNTMKNFYPHSTGHWLGLDVHDQCPYKDNENNEIKLAEGMVITIEPGLYFQSYDKTAPVKLRNMGIRIEDDILITKSGNTNLTKTIPKEVKEIEKACKKSYKTFI